MLGKVYRYDAEARDGALTAAERLRFHQEHSGPVMEKLHSSLEAQFAERKTEPNSGLGKAITSVAALESLDDVSARSRGPIRQ
jgi:transposase